MSTAPRIVGYLNAGSARGLLDDGMSCARLVALVESLGPSKYHVLIDLFEGEDHLEPEWRDELEGFFYRHHLPYGATRGLLEAAVRIVVAVTGLGRPSRRPWHVSRLHALVLRREPQLVVAYVDPTAEAFYVEVGAPWTKRRATTDTLSGLVPGWYGPESLRRAELTSSTIAAIEAGIRAVASLVRWAPRQRHDTTHVRDALPRRAFLEFTLRQSAAALELSTISRGGVWRYSVLLVVGDDPDWRYRSFEQRRLIDPNEASTFFLRRRNLAGSDEVAGPVALVRTGS
jgi:hypothetical protein